MKKDVYKTIETTSEGFFKDRGSKFFSFCYPVSDEETVKEYLKNIKKEHHSARHHCFAYRLGFKEFKYRLNDDGEPSGTAGKPIYGQILSRELTNILIVVVRYFGGTLLGTSGLINTYRSAAEDGLNNVTVAEHTLSKEFEIRFDYNQMNSVMRIIQDDGLVIGKKDFSEICRMKLIVREMNYEKVIKRINKNPKIELIV